jgi:S-adenosylmethionine:tRNA ribosyltransferase-isomerase
MQVLTRDFDYHLPADRIAQQPAPRGESRLLVLDAEGDGRHRRVRDLPELVRPGDLVVVNDTRVIPARLFARRRLAGGVGGEGGGEGSGRSGGGEVGGGEEGGLGGRVELLLVERVGPREWDVLARPGRKARPGTVLVFDDGLEAVVVEREGGDTGDGRHRVRFTEPVEPHLDRLGHVPLPPYIKRPDDPADRERYPTVYARQPGAIAAPTAGLHLTEELLDAVRARRAAVAAITLHVGIGTFKPVTAELVHEHRMERERYEIPAAAAEAVFRTRRAGGRVVAVGTTVVRALEGAADAAGLDDGTVPAGAGATELYITPGFRFRVVDALLTNFHLPRSTLLMLVAAFAGRERVLAAYREAIEGGYRFYSYGDAMLAERSPEVGGG